MESPLKWFEDHRVVAVIRSSSVDSADAMIQAAIAGGVRIFQISTQTPQAIRLIETYSKKQDILVGAGSVSDGEATQRAINAGARFVLTPYTDRDIISVAKNNDTFVIQGALTPTEAVDAHHLGADLIMIYHAEMAGGPQYLKTLRNFAPFLKLAAAGGVTTDNFHEYLKYGVATFMRRSIFAKPLVRSNNWAEITQNARKVTEKLESLKVSR
ncbi:MAG: bifunctional 4-hydroxy-2-oxoglutarate aldolase/2-dehydro-3-deoxy-phosphogluconate aldolase [Candidatus Omnitrophota bacterium]|nr:bifunctional 4-hydroxy-2-oxoglutarate aldolase/2-dehydro-3-deoxy-phosphogluconate aldolase [Candidatus Omnitrophota bacterium]